jgi:heme oxygenase
MRWLQHARLFHFIDWLLQLSDDLSTWFWQELESWEEQQRMPYVTSVERIGIEKGQTTIVLHQLQRKLGDVPEAMQNRILALSSDAIFDLSTALFDFTTRDDVIRWLDAHAPSAADDQ